jgi:hypothetical protein
MFFDKYKGERNEKILQAMLPSSPYSNTPRLVHLKVRIYGDDGKGKRKFSKFGILIKITKKYPAAAAPYSWKTFAARMRGTIPTSINLVGTPNSAYTYVECRKRKGKRERERKVNSVPCDFTFVPIFPSLLLPVCPGKKAY